MGLGGGVACYVGSNLVAKRRGNLESTDMECMWLEVRSNNNNFLLFSCYRPPDENYNFWDELQYMTDLTYLGKLEQSFLLVTLMLVQTLPVAGNYYHLLVSVHSLYI